MLRCRRWGTTSTPPTSPWSPGRRASCCASRCRRRVRTRRTPPPAQPPARAARPSEASPPPAGIAFCAATTGRGWPSADPRLPSFGEVPTSSTAWDSPLGLGTSTQGRPNPTSASQRVLGDASAPCQSTRLAERFRRPRYRCRRKLSGQLSARPYRSLRFLNARTNAASFHDEVSDIV